MRLRMASRCRRRSPASISFGCVIASAQLSAHRVNAFVVETCGQSVLDLVPGGFVQDSDLEHIHVGLNLRRLCLKLCTGIWGPCPPHLAPDVTQAHRAH